MHEPARQRARDLSSTPAFASAQRERKKVEALFAELKNLIERVLILNPRALRIERKHLPALTHKAGSRNPEELSSLQQARDAYEREYILKKIEEAHNNISHAAELLGLERSHLYRKMKALGIAARE